MEAECSVYDQSGQGGQKASYHIVLPKWNVGHLQLVIRDLGKCYILDYTWLNQDFFRFDKIFENNKYSDVVGLRFFF